MRFYVVKSKIHNKWIVADKQRKEKIRKFATYEAADEHAKYMNNKTRKAL